MDYTEIEVGPNNNYYVLIVGLPARLDRAVDLDPIQADRTSVIIIYCAIDGRVKKTAHLMRGIVWVSLMGAYYG